MTSPFIARPELLDADPLTATGRPVRWGVVATGAIAATVTADLALLPDAVLHAVSSRRADRAAEFAERFGFTTSYSDTDERLGYQALFADPDVEAVYVATPHAQHAEVVAAVVRAPATSARGTARAAVRRHHGGCGLVLFNVILVLTRAVAADPSPRGP